MSVKLAVDLQQGFTTIGGALVDVVETLRQWAREVMSSGRFGDVTRTRLYILVGLVPLGLVMLWYHLLPWRLRGLRFRLEEGGASICRGAEWVTLDERDYSEIRATGFAIEFKKDANAPPDVVLPQWRVYSRALDAPALDHLLAKYFRVRLEKLGFALTSEDGARLQRQWVARRAGQGGKPRPPAPS